MPNPNLPPRPGIPPAIPWLIVIPGVLIVIAGLVYFYGTLKPGIKPGKECRNCNPRDTMSHHSCFVRSYSGGECEGLVVRGGDGEHFYVAGTFTTDFRMWSTPTLISKGGTDVFIAKVSNAGNVVWIQSIGGSGDDVPSDIAVDAQGNPLVSINYVNNITVGNNTVSGVTGAVSGLLVKLNKTDGQATWQVSAVAQGGNLKTTIYDIDIKANGSIYTVGSTGQAPVRFSSARGAAVTLQSTVSGAYICEYNANGGVNRVNQFATGDIYDSHLCSDKSSERMLVDFNFNNQIDLHGSKFGNNPSAKNIGYAFILPDGNLVPGSCSVYNSPGGFQGSAQYLGTVVQNQSNQFFIGGYFEGAISFGDLTAKGVMINGIVLSVNPTSYKVVDFLNIHASVSKMRDVALGAAQQVLFGSSYYRNLITENAQGKREVSYQNTSLASGVIPSNAFIANYTPNFQKNWVHRCTSTAPTSGESLTWSVGANAEKIAFTGYVMDTISCDETLPLVMDTFNHNHDFLMKIVDY